jgi:hypothetical protein
MPQEKRNATKASEGAEVELHSFSEPEAVYRQTDRRTGRFNLEVRLPNNNSIGACGSPSTVWTLLTREKNLHCRVSNQISSVVQPAT